ncbi:MAG: helix-turn-helix domain-containing protein [Acidimicrobiales bacterium]
MSVKVQSKVWEHSQATGNALMILIKIADCCDDQGRNAWPSVPTFARYCRCSDATVQRAIRELEALGELEVTRKGGGPRPGSGYAPNLYRVVLERLQFATSQLSTEVAPVNERGRESTDREVAATRPNSITESSRTAAESNKATGAAHLRLAREALGLEERRPDGEPTRPEPSEQ